MCYFAKLFTEQLQRSTDSITVPVHHMICTEVTAGRSSLPTCHMTLRFFLLHIRIHSTTLMYTISSSGHWDTSLIGKLILHFADLLFVLMYRSRASSRLLPLVHPSWTL